MYFRFIIILDCAQLTRPELVLAVFAARHLVFWAVAYAGTPVALLFVYRTITKRESFESEFFHVSLLRLEKIRIVDDLFTRKLHLRWYFISHPTAESVLIIQNKLGLEMQSRSEKLFSAVRVCFQFFAGHLQFDSAVYFAH